MYSVSRLIKELPENYEEECTKQGAVRRWRGVKNAGDLMLLILIHLLNGTSLLETSIIARTAKLGLDASGLDDDEWQLLLKMMRKSGAYRRGKGRKR